MTEDYLPVTYEEMSAEDRTMIEAGAHPVTGARLVNGDMLPDGSIWHPAWPDAPDGGVPLAKMQPGEGE